MPQKWKGGHKAAQKRYREKNKKARNAKSREWYYENLDRVKVLQKEYVRKNRAKVYAYNAAWQQRKRAEYREAVVSGYGHACICCGVADTIFLEIHHPQGNGKADRKRTGGNTYTFYRWLVENKFPKGYELLCANCHKAIHQPGDGICPHKKKDP
jgi:hypothetical protein